MTEKLRQIQSAIDIFDIEEARELLKDELRHRPSAEAYYLASQVAVSEQQKKMFLNKALELDPFHEGAVAELERNWPTTTVSAPPVVIKNPAPPQEIIPSPRNLSLREGTAWRMVFTNLGYRLPDMGAGVTYQKFLRHVGVDDFNSEEESIVLHFGIHSSLALDIQAKTISVTSKQGKILWYCNKGEIIVTNQRIIAVAKTSQKDLLAKSVSFTGAYRVEPVERNKDSQVTIFTPHGNIVMEVTFSHPFGLIMNALSVFNNRPSETKTWLEYAQALREEDKQEQASKALAARAGNIKNAFYQFWNYVTDLS